ncbi:MAG TPA: peroxiredoxin [Bacteroidales bacterium]|nr:peroxiredoxin [Bacteroidales bacterium]
MKTKNVLFFIFLLAIISCKNPEGTDIAELVKVEERGCFKDGIFIHVSSGYDNPHKASMALSLAVKMSETKDVTLFFDIEGVKLLTKTSEDIQMNNFMTVQSALDTLIHHQVQIMACPMCMAKAEIKPEQLREGIIVAEAEKFFSFTKGRILTLDY